MPRWRTLLWKYAAYSAALVTAVLVAVGGVTGYFAYRDAEAAQGVLLREKAGSVAMHIRSFFWEIEQLLAWELGFAGAHPNPERVDRPVEIAGLLRRLPQVTELRWIDPAGRERAFVSRVTPDATETGANFSTDPRFVGARGGRTHASPVYFRNGTEPMLSLAVGSPASQGGVLIAEVNLRFVWEIVSASRVRIGENGLAYVVDSGGQLVSHPDLNLVLAHTDLSRLPHVSDAIAEVPAARLHTRNLSGAPALAAGVPIARLGWTVFAELPAREALAPVYAGVTRTALLGALGLLGALAASYFLARRMVRPIRALREGAARVGAGHLDQQLEVGTGDELGSLAGEFNRMAAQLRESYAGLERKVEERTRELTEALKQQTATAEILRVISSSPTDVQPVFETIARNAVDLCGSLFADVFRFDGELLHFVVSHNAEPRDLDLLRSKFPTRPDLLNVSGRVLLTRSIVRLEDALADPDYDQRFARAMKLRRMLGVPMLREGEPLGAIVVGWRESGPVPKVQETLLETFAEQAVIAIENVRLFRELEARNRDLTEALEQQTATAEILRVIAASPTEIQPVLDAVASTAARLCDAPDALIRRVDGDVLRLAAKYGPIPATSETRPIDRRSVVGRVVLDRQTIHIHDLAAEDQTEIPITVELARQHGYRTIVVTPLVREGQTIGAIGIRRREPRPFSDQQIKLLETFADQAVIAIENVRLFKELQAKNRDLTEALEQQTATADILKVISSSPTDVQPVFETIVQSATTLCRGLFSNVFRFDGEQLHFAATNLGPGYADLIRTKYPMRPDVSQLSGRVLLSKSVVHLEDALADPDYDQQFARAGGWRRMLGVPMLRDGNPLGAIVVGWAEPGPIPVAQEQLLKTFAEQAVIAMENVRLFNEIKEALERQTATAEILRVISQSPGDVAPVLDAVAQRAARICEAPVVDIIIAEGESMRVAATFGELGRPLEALPLDRTTVMGRSIVDKAPVQVADLQNAGDEFAAGRQLARKYGHRTILGVPLVREQRALGTILMRRAEVRPFDDKHVALVQTFADQAAIAIENSRLFKELQERNRDLSEALDQQTATAEILRVISSSPTDVQPVLDAVASTAARLCDASDALIRRVDGDILRLAAHYGPISTAGDETRPIDRGSVSGRAVLDRQTIHIHDMAAGQTEFPLGETWARRHGVRTILAAPLLREGQPIGSIMVRRMDVQPFSDQQIKLLQTFADQAAIAIENARLFQELEARNRDLTEALEQQTATSEALKVISRSAFDLEPVLQTLVENATRLCGARHGQILRFDGQLFHHAVGYGAAAGSADYLARHPLALDSGSAAGRAGLERRTVHIHDVLADPGYALKDLARAEGFRTLLAVPMLREGVFLGTINLWKTEVEPFTDRQIELVTTFADQAVIAIENVRLFNELQARTGELARSVEELQALGEVGRAVSSTLDLENVLTTIVARALELAGADGGTISEYDEPTRQFHLRTSYGVEDELVDLIRAAPIRLGEGITGKAAESRVPVQVADIQVEGAYDVVRIRNVMARLGYRSVLAVPLLREERIIGSLAVWRRQPGQFAPEVVNLLQTFATQSTLAIQHARLFRELEQKSRELELASRHKSEFLANMSHELRTPLNAVLGYTELISDGIYGELPAKIREVIARIDNSGRHLLGLINDVLDLSKIEAGQLTLSLADYSMKELVQTVLVAVESLAADKKLALKVSVPADLPRGRGDERRLSQVLLNLVGNAVKFTEAGEVRVEAGLRDGGFLVSVADTGPGISPSDQERIFEAFQQVDSSLTRRKGGTGLGLAIARRIVELHGGHLWVESAPGRGSTFSFTVPVRVEREVTA